MLYFAHLLGWKFFGDSIDYGGVIMTTKHDFAIEKIKVSTMKIDAEDERIIKQKISKLARGHKKAETEVEVFKMFATALEQTFGAQISSFSPPSDNLTHWRIHLPKDGDFDSTPSRFTVSFHIRRVESL